MRKLTTRIPLATLDRLATAAAPGLAAAVRAQNALGWRSFPPMTRDSATLTLLDVFGPPFMHYHSVDEVTGWFTELGFTRVWSALHSKRGFAVCGRLPGTTEAPA
jgi:hypothetical protein